MSIARLVAIGLIFCGCTVAWMILGGTVVARSGESDWSLRQEVEKLWGTPHVQHAPRAFVEDTHDVKKRVEHFNPDGRAYTREEMVTETFEVPVALSASTVNASLNLEHRKKGLLWFPTYAVSFDGHYTLENTASVPRDVTVAFAFPSSSAIYDGFVFTVGGRDAKDVTNLSGGARTTVHLLPNEKTQIHVAYASRGLDTWTYRFGDGISSVKNFALTLVTDFDDVDFPAGGISPSTMHGAGSGRTMSWDFASLVTGQEIGLLMPSKINPGPVVSRISFFAPVSLLFFFTVLVILGVVKERSLHPMHYFFLGASFFAFHLLLAYLVDHVDVGVAFGIAALTSVGLVQSYLRIVQGTKTALKEAGTAQMVFLVLFSVAFFFEGQTGLAVAVGAVLTLFALMQTTARVDWSSVFGSGPKLSGSPLGVFSSEFASHDPGPSGAIRDVVTDEI